MDNNKGGRPETSGLFKQNGGDLYDLEEFYTSYMEIADPTGYKFAQEVFTHLPTYDRWGEYTRLLGNPWFSNYIQRWQDELEIAIRSSAIQAIQGGCKGGDFASLRWLAEGKASNPPKSGAPTKGERDRKDAIEGAVRNLNPNAGAIIKATNKE